MLLRVVRMEFKIESVEKFHEIFRRSQPKILLMPGCSHVEMCADPKNMAVRYTFSKWESEEHLNAYRNSEFFKSTWKETKALFAGKPSAYSLITQA